MPINPYTGQQEDYNAASFSGEIAMGAMDMAGVTASLPFRMLEQSPGMMGGMGFSVFRGSNTLLRGGSNPALFKTKAAPQDWYGATRGARKMQKGRSPWLRRALQQNAPRPRNFMQFTDMSIFADPSKNMYTPFSLAGMFGNSKSGRAIGKKITGETVEDGTTAFGGGTLSAVSAGVRVDRLERKAARGDTKAISRLMQVDRNIGQLAELNHPESLKVSVVRKGPLVAPLPPKTGLASDLVAGNTRLVGSNIGYGPSEFANASRNRMMITLGGPNVGPVPVGQVGVRGNMMASNMAGKYTQQIAGYARGALGFGADDMASVGLLRGAAGGAGKAEARFARSFVKAFGDAGMVTRSGATIKGTEEAATAFLRSTAGKSIFREMGAVNVGKVAASGGAKMLAARGAALAIPGLQVVAAISLAYDLAQVAGEAFKGSINLAKDAAVSLRGDINKPDFGMGYRDTEAAATSRARGVMAIQNSRLNMRSLLGSEAAMMAARYG